MRDPARHFAPWVTVTDSFSWPKHGKTSLGHGKCVTHRLRGHRFPAFPAFPAFSAPATPSGHEKRRHPPGTVFFVSVLCVQTNSLLIEMRITHRKNLLYVASILTPNYNMLISFQKPVVTVCKWCVKLLSSINRNLSFLHWYHSYSVLSIRCSGKLNISAFIKIG